MEGKVRCEHCIMSRDAKGNWVFHTDHLRAVTLAKIDALEELIAHMRARFTSASNPTGSYCNEESLWISEKIAALRKELGS